MNQTIPRKRDAYSTAPDDDSPSTRLHRRLREAFSSAGFPRSEEALLAMWHRLTTPHTLRKQGMCGYDRIRLWKSAFARGDRSSSIQGCEGFM